MILNRQKAEEFEELTRPLIKWLNENCHPHVTAIVEPGHAVLVESIFSYPTNDYIKD